VATLDDNAHIKWIGGKPYRFGEGTLPWQRTEFVRKMTGKTVAAFVKAASKERAFAGKSDPRSTLISLLGDGLIEVEGYHGRVAMAQAKEAFHDALYDIVSKQQPMTVRQAFYQASVHGLVPKDEEKGYNPVQRALVQMRKAEMLPWEWIVDLTRERIEPLTFRDVSHSLEYIANVYRKKLWGDINAYVEIWLEKEALIGIIEDITMRYDVSLMPARGYSSATFLKEAAENIELQTKPVFIYYFGDYDPSGQDAIRACKEFLDEYAPSADITFTPLAILPEQLNDLKFAWRETKQSDTRAANFGSKISVELDALTPKQLRKLVEDAIKKHLRPKKYKELKAQEELEQQQIRDVIDEIDLEDSGI
jgi:hypothetical protein